MGQSQFSEQFGGVHAVAATDEASYEIDVLRQSQVLEEIRALEEHPDMTARIRAERARVGG